MEEDWCCPDPSYYNWNLTENPSQGYVKVKFAAPTPLNILEVATYASNEFSMSDYCRFVQLILSLPSMEGTNLDFDLGIEYNDSSLSDGARYEFVLYAWYALAQFDDEE